MQGPFGTAKHRLILHITPFAALESILSQGALLCNSKVKRVQDISNPEIQAIRASFRPPDPPGGTLHDYVPFYFGQRSPMLFQLATGHVPSFKGAQRDIIYCVSSVQNVIREGLEFTFTNGHAVMAFTQFFTDLSDLDKIDWRTVEARYWRDDREDPKRQWRKQAEFLVKDRLPVSALLGFAVADAEMQASVDSLLTGYPQYTFKVPTRVRDDWYYE